MDYAAMPAQHYKDACNKIREKTETTELVESGEFASKVEAVFNKGAEQVNRTLNGIYILKDTVDVEALISKYGFFEEDLVGKGVYAYFIDDYGNLPKYAPIDKFKLYNNVDGYDSLEFRSGILADKWGLDAEFLLYYAPASWSSLAAQYGYLYDGEYCYEWDAEIPNKLQSKIITFTQPIVVSQETYDVINAVTDNSQAITEMAEEKGAKSTMKSFWNNAAAESMLQSNYVYASPAWDRYTFRPASDVVLPVTGYGYYFAFVYNDKRYQCNITDLEACLAHNDVYINFRNRSTSYYEFAECTKFVNIGRLRFGSITRYNGTFHNCQNLVTISSDLPVNASTTFLAPFYNCKKLQEVRFKGTIGQGGLNFQYSTVLSKASWQNIIGCLSATASGLSMTGSLASVNKAFETSEGANDGSTSAEWLNLIATKPNWTINLL